MVIRIVLDPGHGGSSEVDGSSPNNAEGPSGLLEKTVTLDIANRVLARAVGLEIILTRSTDTNLGLAARAGIAKQKAAAAFVSVHLNGWTTPDVQGTETYVHTNGSAKSVALANKVHASVLAATGLSDRGLKRAGFKVLDPSLHNGNTAACLIEISFLTQAKEEARLRTDAYLNQLADALIAAIETYTEALKALPESGLARSDIKDVTLLLGVEDAAGTNMKARSK